MPTALVLEQQVTAQPGDEFIFVAESGVFVNQFHIQVDGAGGPVHMGVWGPNNPHLGKAMNKPGKAYIDRTLPKGLWRITVEGATGPYQIVVTKNSWFHKVFGASETE